MNFDIDIYIFSVILAMICVIVNLFLFTISIISILRRIYNGRFSYINKKGQTSWKEKRIGHIGAEKDNFTTDLDIKKTVAVEIKQNLSSDENVTDVSSEVTESEKQNFTKRFVGNMSENLNILPKNEDVIVGTDDEDKDMKGYLGNFQSTSELQISNSAHVKTKEVTVPDALKIKNLECNQREKESLEKDCNESHSLKRNLSKKVQQLSWTLGGLRTFNSPNIKLEQYATSPEIAGFALHFIEMHYHDISNKKVADLGCGCGVLTIGAHLLNAELCVGFDVCKQALKICHQNVSELNCDNVKLVEADIIDLNDSWFKTFDTVLMNPPFGTKGNKSMDINFLRKALELSKTAVYSFHKTATREFIKKVTRKWSVKMELLYQVKFDLPKTYKKHKHAVKDIEVDFIRCSF